jgi:uncharacterized HAD superfamily protein
MMNAADAAGISVAEAAQNIVETVGSVADNGAIFLAALNRPTIICDIDGVLCDYASGACAAVNARFGTSYLPSMFTTYTGPFTQTERDWLYEERFADGAFWAALSPDTEAIAALRRLAVDHPTILSSERPSVVKDATTAWLELYGVPNDAIYLVGPGGKRQIVDQYEDRTLILIDDNPARWLDCARPNVTILTPSRPWVPAPVGYAVTIFQNWDQVEDMLADLPRGSLQRSLGQGHRRRTR